MPSVAMQPRQYSRSTTNNVRPRTHLCLTLRVTLKNSEVLGSFPRESACFTMMTASKLGRQLAQSRHSHRADLGGKTKAFAKSSKTAQALTPRLLACLLCMPHNMYEVGSWATFSKAMLRIAHGLFNKDLKPFSYNTCKNLSGYIQ
jgi:hypothetical protein